MEIPNHRLNSKQDYGDFDCDNDNYKDKDGTDANITIEEDGGGDGYRDCEQMGRAKGTHRGGC